MSEQPEYPTGASPRAPAQPSRNPKHYFVDARELARRWRVPMEDVEEEGRRRGLKGFRLVRAPTLDEGP